MKKQNTGALEAVVLRNDFYRDSYYKAHFAVLLAIIINCVLAFAIYYKVSHPPEPEYFASTDDGRIVMMHSLSDPGVSNDFILQWAATNARKAFSVDFMHWKEQLQENSKNFSSSGWTSFIEQLKASNNLRTIKDLEMVSDAQVTEAPQIVRQGVISGRYVWKITMPLLVTYKNANKTIPQTVQLTMVVIREPITDAPHGLAINMFLADTGNNDSASSLL